MWLRPIVFDMVEARWEDIRGRDVRFRGERWELTGEVDVLGTGERLRARARQVDDEKHRRAALLFGLDEPGESLNPGDLEDVFVRVEREGGESYLVARKEPRTYRYVLRSLEYE